ncbi:uncharacterized protein [Phaenicophaeus curvirostris]|uniref:uncharacterized protein n=1 Tax=Phaenicophaeus curvirostris TaxID=33595 RepID=UPI0037F0C9CE
MSRPVVQWTCQSPAMSTTQRFCPAVGTRLLFSELSASLPPNQPFCPDPVTARQLYTQRSPSPLLSKHPFCPTPDVPLLPASSFSQPRPSPSSVLLPASSFSQPHPSPSLILLPALSFSLFLMPLIQGSALSTCSQRLRPHRLMKACKKRMLILKKAGSTAAQPNTRGAMEPTRCLKRIRNTVPASRVVMESKRSILQLKALLHEFWLFNVMLETAKVAASNMGWRKELDEEEPMEIDEKVIVDVEMEEDTEEPMDIDEEIIVDVEMEEDTEEPMDIDEKIIMDVEMEEDTDEPEDIDEKIIVDVEIEEDMEEPMDVDEKIIVDVEMEEDTDELEDIDEKIIEDVEMEEDTEEAMDVDEKIIVDVEMEEDTEEAMDVDEKIIVDVEMEEDTEEPMDIDEKIIMDVEMEDMEEAMDIDDKIIVDVELEEEEEEMWINPPSPGQARRGVGCGGKWMRGRQIKDTIRMTTMWPKTTMRTR